MDTKKYEGGADHDDTADLVAEAFDGFLDLPIGEPDPNEEQPVVVGINQKKTLRTIRREVGEVCKK